MEERIINCYSSRFSWLEIQDAKVGAFCEFFFSSIYCVCSLLFRAGSLNNCGYHRDDSYLYRRHGKHESLALAFTSGDIIGAAISYLLQETFFTLNDVVLDNHIFSAIVTTGSAE